LNRAKEGGGLEFLNFLAPPRKGFTWNPASGCNNLDCGARKPKRREGPEFEAYS
jgi:hypothetical protein